MVQMIKDYNGTADWSVGALFAHDKFIHQLIDVLKELGYENPIKSVFGSIPCLMSGGVLPPTAPPVEVAKSIIDKYNDRGVGCNLTYSNVFVKEEGFDDPQSNELLEFLNDKTKVKNGVIVSDPRYAEYLRNKYSNLTVIGSYMKPVFEVGLGNDSAKYYNDMFNDFDLITVNPEKVQNYEFLSNLEHKDRVIFSVNSRELPNDPLVKEFFKAQMMTGIKALDDEDYAEETNTLDEIYKSWNKTRKSYPLAGTNLSQSDIENLIRMGFKHFNILGRENDGATFIRDLGDYVFISHLYNRVAQAIMQSVM